MNLGFYIDSLGKTDTTCALYDALNAAVEHDGVDDVSLFYNNVAFNDSPTNFGLFNSTDIWHFTGNLVVSSLSSLAFAQQVVNKFTIYYLVEDVGENIFKLILATDNVKVLVKDAEGAAHFYRVTGKHADGIIGNYNIEAILGAINGN